MNALYLSTIYIPYQKSIFLYIVINLVLDPTISSTYAFLTLKFLLVKFRFIAQLLKNNDVNNVNNKNSTITNNNNQQTATQWMPTKNYKILGLRPSETSSHIKSAYRNLALKYNPDKMAYTPTNKTCTSHIFTKVSTSYNTLSNKDQQKENGLGGSGQ